MSQAGKTIEKHQSEGVTLDPVWEEKYSQGLMVRYPWDAIVSFVFRSYPREKQRQDVKILELGCGTGCNLWFAAREGFQVAGIDGSKTAIEQARSRFEQEGLKGDLQVGDFTQLPFADQSFDLVIDRGALTCCGFSAAAKAINEAHRVLRTGGKFFFNPYSDRHSSFAAGTQGPDGVTIDIKGGTMTNVGQVCFYGKRQVLQVLSSGWNLSSLQHLELSEEISAQYSVHAEWRAIAEKI